MDAIRFVCAFAVVMFHFGVDDLLGAFGQTDDVRILYLLLHSPFNGLAAVAVFFVVSGFCIHFPVYHGGGRVHIVAYLIRRYLRVGIPYVAAYGFYRLMGFSTKPYEGVFWTLVCELMYYTLYPVLLAARNRFGSWRPVLATSLLIAAVMTLSRPSRMEIYQIGVVMTWLYALPLWLFGCVLAEHFSQTAGSRPAPPKTKVWLLRASVVLAAALIYLLRETETLGYTWTLFPFGAFAAYTLRVEMEFSQMHAPSRWLESMGAWSYSLYAVHMPAKKLIDGTLHWTGTPLLLWAVKLAGVLFIAFVFYLLVERPGHILARKAAEALGAQRSKT